MPCFDTFNVIAFNFGTTKRECTYNFISKTGNILNIENPMFRKCVIFFVVNIYIVFEDVFVIDMSVNVVRLKQIKDDCCASRNKSGCSQ